MRKDKKQEKKNNSMDFKIFLLGLFIIIFGAIFLFSRGLILGSIAILPGFGLIIIAMGLGISLFSFKR